MLGAFKIDKTIGSGLTLISRKRRELMIRYSRPEPIRMAFEDLGPTFIKLGQALKARLKDGRAVVLKIQRPGLEKPVAVDLGIMCRNRPVIKSAA